LNQDFIGHIATSFVNFVYIHIQPFSGLRQYTNYTVGFTHGYSHSIPLGF